jgi:hypothetical protein
MATTVHTVRDETSLAFRLCIAVSTGGVNRGCDQQLKQLHCGRLPECLGRRCHQALP